MAAVADSEGQLLFLDVSGRVRPAQTLSSGRAIQSLHSRVAHHELAVSRLSALDALSGNLGNTDCRPSMRYRANLGKGSQRLALAKHIGEVLPESTQCVYGFCRFAFPTIQRRLLLYINRKGPWRGPSYKGGCNRYGGGAPKYLGTVMGGGAPKYPGTVMGAGLT